MGKGEYARKKAPKVIYPRGVKGFWNSEEAFYRASAEHTWKMKSYTEQVAGWVSPFLKAVSSSLK